VNSCAAFETVGCVIPHQANANRARFSNEPALFWRQGETGSAYETVTSKILPTLEQFADSLFRNLFQPEGDLLVQVFIGFQHANAKILGRQFPEWRSADNFEKTESGLVRIVLKYEPGAHNHIHPAEREGPNEAVNGIIACEGDTFCLEGVAIVHVAHNAYPKSLEI